MDYDSLLAAITQQKATIRGLKKAGSDPSAATAELAALVEVGRVVRFARGTTLLRMFRTRA